MNFYPSTFHLEKTLNIPVPVSQSGLKHEFVSVGDWVHVLKNNGNTATVQVLYIQNRQLVVRFKGKLFYANPEKVIKLLPGE